MSTSILRLYREIGYFCLFILPIAFIAVLVCACLLGPLFLAEVSGWFALLLILSPGVLALAIPPMMHLTIRVVDWAQSRNALRWIDG